MYTVHPKSENIRKVIDVFKSVLPMALKENYGLRMSATKICGTFMCHGGWFYIGVNGQQQGATFSNGIKLMSKMLGLDNGYYLASSNAISEWAYGNKGVWGNDSGLHMFGSASAFNESKKRPHGAKNLQHIIDHWEEVYDRVKALEDAQKTPEPQPIQKYTDITSQLAVLPTEEKSDAVLLDGVEKN